MTTKFKRVTLLVLDSLGVGYLPDAKKYGDEGANTLAHIAKHVNGLKLPNLESWGLGNIIPIAGVKETQSPKALFGKANELSHGKDTTTGHWEFAGLEIKNAFPTFPNGFSKEFIDRFIQENNLPGVLGNCTASGTKIIEDMGEEHLATGKPIVYTSADSVFQICAHEEKFGLDRLYKICENARTQCDEIHVSRVIARPFLGSTAQDFYRTGNRKDYSIDLPGETMMDYLLEEGKETISIGKVANIYNNRGFSKKVPASGNKEIMQAVQSELKNNFEGLLFANFVDFDMLFGHRRDPEGYAKELEWFDALIPELTNLMTEEDLLILTADHGNDPTFKGADHTREYVPVLAWCKATEKFGGKDLATLHSFADVGQSIMEALGSNTKLKIGSSFLPEISYR